MVTGWYALIPESNLKQRDSVHVFPSMPTGGLGRVNVHLVLLRHQPESLKDLPLQKPSDVMCLASCQPLNELKNTIRNWSTISSVEGFQGEWLWYVPCIFESLFAAQNQQVKQKILNGIDQLIVIRPDEISALPDAQVVGLTV